MKAPAVVNGRPKGGFASVDDNSVDWYLALNYAEQVDGALAGDASNFQDISHALFGCFCDTESIDEDGFARKKSCAVDCDVMIWELGL